MTIKFVGDKYEGTKIAYFKICPKGTSITNLTKHKKAFTVKWKKQSAKMSSTRISGYQIRYSRNSNMKNSTIKTVGTNYKTTSKKITGLSSNKKYYVQIRTYKTVNGTKYYSAWSSKKNIKTK